jgi:hypothetical protein
MRRIQNIVNIQHTDNNKYIKFKVPNIIIKTARLHNSGLKYVVTDKVYKLNAPQKKQLWDKIKPSRLLSMRLRAHK